MRAVLNVFCSCYALFQLLELNIVQLLYHVSNLSISVLSTSVLDTRKQSFVSLAITNCLFSPLVQGPIDSARPAPLAIYKQIYYCILEFSHKLEFICKYFAIQNIKLLGIKPKP